MAQDYRFTVLVAIVAGVGLVAVLSNRLTAWIRVPAPALFLVGAAVTVKVIPALNAPAQDAVRHAVTVALVVILFDGGARIGWRRLRAAAVPVTITGVAGTLATAAGGAVLAHLAFGLDWYLALLLATAVAPTDPAVVFSVLGQREIAGRSGTILEGESGANDPVGIALMASLLAAGSLSGSALAHVGGEFAVQLLVGLGFGVAGGRALLWFTRRVPLPSEGLYALRTLASIVLLFAVATLAHGSGFLAVFTAGIVVGDPPAPYKREIERFHAALASLAEIVAFILLGLTINLDLITQAGVWVPGLILGAALTLIIRPALVGLCLLPAQLTRNERAFVVLAGLKGAVPILLGSFVLTARVPAAQRLYGIVAVVVIFSVIVQGSLIPAAARLLHLKMTQAEPEPWALGVRLREEPGDAHRFTVAAGAPADGLAVDDLTDLPGDAWVSLILRDNQLLTIAKTTALQAGDDVIVLAPAKLHDKLVALFQPQAR